MIYLCLEKTHNVYDMANCFLSLNILREWIRKDDEAPENLKVLDEKIYKAIGKMGNNLDFEKLKNNDVVQSIHLIRMFCNHAKHKDEQGEFVEISMGAKLPATFPIKFEYLSIGENFSIKATDVLKKCY